jgi:CHAT domain-containing protein
MKQYIKKLALLVEQPVGVCVVFAVAACMAAGQEVAVRKIGPFPDGKTAIQADLGPTEAHIYTLKLKPGEALRVDVFEKGVDCVVSVLYLPDKKNQEMMFVNFGIGLDRETITYIAKNEGEYAVMLAASTSRAGYYILTGAINPRPSGDESQRAQAVQSLADGVKLWESVTETKALDAEAMVQSLQRSLALWKGLKEDYWIGYTANRLGRGYAELSQKDKAVEYLGLALKTFRKISNKRGEAVTLYNLGGVYAEFGQQREALNFYMASLPLMTELGDEVIRAQLLASIGVIYSNTDSLQTAREYFEEALRILRDIKDVETEAGVLANIGAAYWRAGDVSQGLSNLNQALTMLELTDDLNLKAHVLSHIASLYSNFGEAQKALEYCSRTLALYEKSGNRRGMAEAHAALGSIYHSLGEFQAALEHTHKSLAIYRQARDIFGEAGSLIDLADLYVAIRDKRRASETIDKVFELMTDKGTENQGLIAKMFLGASDVLIDEGNYELAAKTLDIAIHISRSTGNKNTEASALNSLAKLYFYTGEKVKSADTCNQAYLIASSTGDTTLATVVLSNLMYIWHGVGNPQLAIFYGKEALNRYQGFRTRLRGLDRETQKAYLREHVGIYVNLADLLLERGRQAEALQVLTAYQDQQFYDFNHDPNTPARQIALTPREAAFASTHNQTSERVVALGQQLEELKWRAGATPSPEETKELARARLAEQLKTASEEFYAALRQATADFSRVPREEEASRRVEDLTGMQASLRELSVATARKTVAIYTLVSGRGLRILLITPDSVVTATSPIKSGDFYEKVLQYHALLQSSAYDPRPLGKYLYDIIFKPIEPALRATGAQTLLWSLDGPLRYVPMAALWDGKHYLVERYQHVVFTRADRERMTRAVNSDWFGIGFGSSRKQVVDLPGNEKKVPFGELPGVLDELKAIFLTGENAGGVVKGEILMDDRFTKASLMDVAKRRYKLVHIASHFSFRPGNDTQSFLLLGDGTALTLNEIKGHGKLFEGVELLTLSACDTAATRGDAMGREIDGFAESAQRLGAGAVMATLWMVADNSTPQLMREFYRARQRGSSLTKAEALRRAQLALLNGESGLRPLSAARASGSPFIKVELVDTLNGGKRRPLKNYGRGAEIVYVKKNDAPPFQANPNKPFAHPYYWAPFILIGNGR